MNIAEKVRSTTQSIKHYTAMNFTCWFQTWLKVSPPVFRGDGVAQSLVSCVWFRRSLFGFFVLFLLDIVLSVLLRLRLLLTPVVSSNCPYSLKVHFYAIICRNKKSDKLVIIDTSRFPWVSRRSNTKSIVK